MSFLSFVLLAATAFVAQSRSAPPAQLTPQSQAGGCTATINQHFQCIDQVMKSSPDHEQEKARVDACFTDARCRGTPETFFQEMGIPPPPTKEQHECIGDVQERMVKACQDHLGTSYQFPNMRQGPPMPPPSPPGHGGPLGHGPPNMDSIILQLCPTQAPQVRQCVHHDSQTSGGRQNIHQEMQRCFAILQRNPHCVQKLTIDSKSLCQCTQQLLQRGEWVRPEYKKCANIDQSTIFAQEIRQAGTIKPLPPHLAGPICGPNGPLGPHGASGPPPGPPPPGFGRGPQNRFGPPPFGMFGQGSHQGQFGQGSPQAPFGQGPPEEQFGQELPQVQFGQGPRQGQFGQELPQGQFGQGPSQGQFGQGPPQGQFGKGPPQAPFGQGFPQVQFGQVGQQQQITEQVPPFGGQFGNIQPGEAGQQFQPGQQFDPSQVQQWGQQQLQAQQGIILP